MDVVDRDEARKAHRLLWSEACKPPKNSGLKPVQKRELPDEYPIKVEGVYHITHRFLTCLCPNRVFFAFWIRDFLTY